MIAPQPDWLSAEDPDGPSKLYYRFQTFCTRALVVKRAESGWLICIPRNGIPLRYFEEAESHGYPGDLGPYVETTVPAIVGSRQQERLLEVIIFDLDSGGFLNLSLSKPEEVAEEEVVSFGKFRKALEWPAAASLLEAATNFVAQGGDRLEGYFSALEEPKANGLEIEPEFAEADPGTGVEALLKQLLSQSEVTQRVVTGMQDGVATLDRLESRLKVLEQRGPLGATPKAAAAPQLFNPGASGLTPLRSRPDLLILPVEDPADCQTWVPLHKPSNPRSSPMVALSRIPEDPEEEDEEGVALAPESGSTLEALLASQTKILEKLASSKASAHDPLNLLSSHVENEEAPRSRRSERHCCPAGLDGQLQTASQPSGDALSRAPICGQTQRKRFRAGAKRPLVSLPGERPSWQPQDFDLHGIPECCHVRSSGTKGLRQVADAGGAAIGVHRAGGPRRRVVTFGPSSDVLGGSTICPDGVASHGSCRTAPRTAVRSSLGSYSTGLLAGHRDHCGQVHEAPSPCKTDRGPGRCSSKEGSQMAAEKASEEPRDGGGRSVRAPPSMHDATACTPQAPAGVGHAASVSQVPDFVSSRSYGVALFKTFYSSRTPLGNFCRQCLHMKGNCHDSSKQLFPCPIPAKLAAPTSELRSGRRRGRYLQRVTIREHLRMFVATCNWLVLGRPKELSVSWPPCSAAQSRMLVFLEDGISLFYRLSPGPSSGLDRALGKFSSIGDSLQQLTVATQALRRDLDSYNRGSRPPGSSDATSRVPEDSDQSVPLDLGGSGVEGSGVKLGGLSQNSTAMQLDPDRIQFKRNPSFDAERFINDPLLKAGFMNPRHLLLPSHQWPSVRRARVMCPRELTVAEIVSQVGFSGLFGFIKCKAIRSSIPLWFVCCLQKCREG